MKNKIPKLRFSEFRNSGEWVEKRLGEIFKFVRGPFGGTLKKEFFVENGYAVYEQYNAIYNDFNSIRYFISEEKFAKLERFSLKENDLIMSCSGTMGKFAIVPKKIKKGIINQALLKLTLKNTNNDVIFLKNILELPINKEQLLSQSAGGAIKNVAPVAQIKDIKIYIPYLKEQQKIADTLKSLDDLIEAQSKKVEKLKEYKKGLMQKLFPAEGKKVPEIRFKEFSGEWVEKRLGDIAEIFKGKGLSKSQLNDNGEYLCIHYGELFTQYKEVINKVKNKTFEFCNSVKSIKNDVLMPTSDVTPTGLAKASCLKLSNVIIGGDILIIRAGIYGEFLSRYIRLLKNEILKLTSGTTVFHLYASDLKRLKIYIPTLPEQQKIADTLSSLDNLIEAESKKIEALKKHKKGLMQQLFVGEDE